jgi:tetratricopeptide (TPR) repeat protein
VIAIHSKTKPGRALAVTLALAGLLPALAALAEEPDALVAQAGELMRRARLTADAADYARAGAALDQALALEPSHYGALRARAWVLLGQHDFRGARVAAERALAVAPEDWWNHATRTDACVELGDYDCAVAEAERAVALRPGLPTYARVAFLRALLGDRPGAVSALELAVASGSAQDAEGLAWALVHLGHEHFAAGDLRHAGAAYVRALDVLPDYYLALAGLGRVRAAEHRLDEAAGLYRKAVARVPAPDLVAALADVLAAAGDAEGAERQLALVDYAARVAAATGTTYGRQLALVWADHDRRLPDALRLVRAEAARRGDVFTDDALAWTLFKNDRPVAAMRAAHRALRLGTPDAALHYHAGLIAAALGRPARAARHLARALALNPHFDLRQAPLCRAALLRIEPRVELAEGTP